MRKVLALTSMLVLLAQGVRADNVPTFTEWHDMQVNDINNGISLAWRMLTRDPPTSSLKTMTTAHGGKCPCQDCGNSTASATLST